MRRKIAPNSPGIVALRRCYRRISPIAVRLGEGPMSDHAADVQPARRERVFVPRRGHPLDGADIGGPSPKRTFVALDEAAWDSRGCALLRHVVDGDGLA